MLINNIYSLPNQIFQATNVVVVNGKRLIPRAEYKGPILKLTKADNQDIAKLQKQIENLEIEHIKIVSILSNKKFNGYEKDYYNDTCIKIEHQINTLKNQIEHIKSVRHQKQLLGTTNQGTGS